MRELLTGLLKTVTDEEEQACLVLRDICVNNDLHFLDQLVALQYFAGIEPGLIVSKINTIDTPLIANAIFLIH